MSYKTYNLLWGEAQRTLDDALQIDTIIQTEKLQREEALQAVSELYVKYIVIVKKLDQCYDQMLQPQKRLIIRKVLDATIGRVLEMKQELVNLDMSEFSYFDGILTEMNLLPQDVEIGVPKYYKRERENEIREKKKTMDDILKKLGYLDEEEPEKEMSLENAIRLIQVHERARQGRLRFQFMKEIKMLKEKSKPEAFGGSQASSNFAAAIRIQKTWRGYIERRKIFRKKMEEMLLIGMVHPSFVSREERKKAEEIEKIRRKLQDEYQKDYEKLNEIEKESCRKRKEGKLIEDMIDEIRSWYMHVKNQTGKFPEIPSDDSGGSALIFRSSSRQGTETSLSKSTGGSSERSKKSRTKEDTNKKKMMEEDDEGFKISPSNFLQELLNSKMEFDLFWNEKLNDTDERPYLDMIKAENEAEVEKELRKMVDAMMREELEILQAALDRDRAKKGKKSKRVNKKKGKRTGKKSKKKKEKDLTPDRTLESLFEELITNGIIKKYPETLITDFKGEKSFANFDLRHSGKDPLPALGDIRQVITEYCILPLGSKIIHQNSPFIRSLLIAGPRGSGKNMLVHAICTEVGAILFDLSPANIVGKYPGKSGLIMLMHLVSKVARLMQPAVIYMNGAEKPFMKKVPKTDKTDPKRLKKDLPRLVKSFCSEDQIMLIGVSNTPWECDQKALQQTYNKFIFIPKPDYSSLNNIYMELFFNYSGVSRQFDVGAMAKLSDGYTVGSIIESVKEVMSCKRVLQLVVQPLTHYEIINALSKRQPIYKEEEEAFLQWYSKTPIARKKYKYLEMLREEEINMQKNQN
ncbi:conserved hypothetical protein [Pediculus humanus corporis]|uniref:ATPase AAA-type core domain-containing protein n=1 Tax=Pediculus humanus subsp. corporis TaxID=121224 RepID=E0W0Z2_PEDHC|nr:uncharacterized protein Phum_PHUM565820 [Pediculus humanus corporis]EEB19297.1 conserved hypothetical protein [Pediculus humanus corporis]